MIVRGHPPQLVSSSELKLPREGASAAQYEAEAGFRWGRDVGLVSARNTSKGALILEAQAVFRAFDGTRSLDELRDECVRGTILRQRARETRERIWQALYWRFFAWNPPDWVLAEVAAAARGSPTDPRFVGTLYVHHARRDRLTFDFVVEKLWDLWQNKTVEVRRNDVLDFLATYEDQHPQVKSWRESTRKKLAGNVLSALRDFGLLKGVQRKVIQQPVVPLEVVLHLSRLLYGEGLRGRAVLEARDWRLFLWQAHQTAEAFVKLAQKGKLRFERSGRTVILEIPEMKDGSEQ